jgi:hypothetical protein
MLILLVIDEEFGFAVIDEEFGFVTVKDEEFGFVTVKGPPLEGAGILLLQVRQFLEEFR